MIFPGTKPRIKNDIVFLIDGSDDVRSKFPAMRDFIATLVDNFELDQGEDKVAVVQYSNDAEVSFNLDTYNTRDDIIKHIKMLRPKGGRPQYIGAALQFVKDNVFVSKAKDQHHHRKQILVVMTGGRSRDSPRGPASMLKAAGVVAFAIGSKMSNLSEMNIISSDKSYSYIVSDFDNLPLIQQLLLNYMTHVGVKEETKLGKHVNLLL